MKYIFLIAMLLTSLVNAETKKQFLIITTITVDKETLSSPMVVTKVGEEAEIRIVKEKYLPKDWSADIETMLPKPSFDDPTDFGIAQKAIIKETEKDGQKLTLLHGEFILRAEGNTPKLTSEIPDDSSKSYLFFQTEKKVYFAFDMSSREKVSYTFEEAGKSYQVDMEISEVIREKSED